MSFYKETILIIISTILILILALPTAQAGTREQAKRIHERLAGVAPSETILGNMQSQLDSGDAISAAMLAI